MTDLVPLAPATLVVFSAWIAWDIRRIARRHRENRAAWDDADAAARAAAQLEAEGRAAAARFAWRQYRGRLARAEAAFRRAHGKGADEALARIEASIRSAKETTAND